MKLREEEFYEQYHQHGGTTIIPTEIFNELYDDATEEIERLNKENERIRTELNGKESIIKEVREYLMTTGYLWTGQFKEIDFVTKEGRIAGKGASKYLSGLVTRDSNNIECFAGNGVSYVIPNYINKSNIDESVEFKFRVRGPMENKKVVILSPNPVPKRLMFLNYSDIEDVVFSEYSSAKLQIISI